MNLFEAIGENMGRMVKAYANATRGAPVLPLSPRYAQYDDTEDAAENANLYANLSWVAAAIDAVINLGSTVDFQVTRGENVVEAAPILDLFDHPNPQQSRGEFLGAVYAFYKLSGNGYIYMPRPSDTTPPTELWVVPSQMIEPVSDGKSGVQGYLFLGAGGERIPIDPWMICHLMRFNPLNNLVGLSELASLELASDLDLASQRWNANFFSKNNAKPQGALTFADNIRKEDWDQLQKDAREKWGGTNRSGPMMLRGVGQGAVNWLQMGISQADMQFLEARTFTKEEIWSVTAPGLASMLAVNATEANALAGKATFIELCIYPLVTRFAESVTKHIMPAYGEDDKLKVVDPRIKNAVLEMQQIDQYARFHTIDETRTKYYSAESLQDIGGLLVAQVSAATATPAPDFASPDIAGEGAPVKAELGNWKRHALKRLGHTGARPFVAVHTPAELAGRITAGLQKASTRAEVEAVFEEPSELTRLAQAIESAAAKL